MNNYTVYKHVFPNNKIYVGMTSLKPNRRWDNGRGYITQELMARAINKYGWENVEHIIIASGLNKTEAEQMEISLIAELKANNPSYGYNIENGGNCPGSHSEITRKKIGDAQRGEKNHMYGKPSPMRGKKRTPEQIENNRKAHLGQPSIWKGKKAHPNLVKAAKRPKSESHRMKLSDAHSVPVLCVETGVIYKNGKEAAEAVGINRGGVNRAIKSENATAGGFHWRRLEKGQLKNYGGIEGKKWDY